MRVNTNEIGGADMQYEYTEKDWKLFRSKIVKWQEDYIDSLNKAYIKLLNENLEPSEKFWKLSERMKSDKKQVGVMVDMRRSKLIENISSLINSGAIRFSDIQEFSDDLKEAVKFWTKEE
jgi:hypothetical protein